MSLSLADRKCTEVQKFNKTKQNTGSKQRLTRNVNKQKHREKTEARQKKAKGFKELKAQTRRAQRPQRGHRQANRQTIKGQRRKQKTQYTKVSDHRWKQSGNHRGGKSNLLRHTGKVTIRMKQEII